MMLIFNKDLPRDQVIVKNTSSAAIIIILSYQPFERRYTAKLLGGATVGAKAGSGIITGITANAAANTKFEVAYEEKVREAKPQKFNLGPNKESGALPIEIGTRKLYYTVIVPNGNEERVPLENLLWPQPKSSDKILLWMKKFLPRMKQHCRGNVLEITNMHGTRSIATSLTMLIVIVLGVLYGPSVWAFFVDLASPANNRRPIVDHLTRLPKTCGELLKSSKVYIRNNRRPIVHHLTRLQTTCGELLKSSKVHIRKMVERKNENQSSS